MTDTMRPQLATMGLHVLYAGGVLLIGLAAGYILGRAIASFIPAPKVAGLVGRLCIIAGTLSALPLAFRLLAST